MAISKDIKQLKNPKVWKKAFNKSGRQLETAGYGITALGTVTGQPELVALGGGAIGVGKAYQAIGTGIQAASGGKVSEARKKEIKSDILKASKGSF